MEVAALAPTRCRKQIQAGSGTIWTPEEDELLKRLVMESESVSWCVLANFFPDKTAPQLAGRWDKVLNPCLIKGSWTREEDETIVEFVRIHGNREWAKLALLLQGRTGKQCRERFKNHLDDRVKRTSWSAEEDQMLADLHGRYGNAWTKIATFFEGRTDNCIKNRWNSTIKKRLERIELGQPPVRKRGRKPKSTDERSNGGNASASSASSCSSPLDPEPRQCVIPRIELMPVNPHLRMKFGRPPEAVLVPSLEQNRKDLQRMLSGSSVE